MIEVALVSLPLAVYVFSGVCCLSLALSHSLRRSTWRAVVVSAAR